MWTEEQGTPYRGWYNGNVDLMIKNGTFGDFLPKIMKTAELGKYSLKGTMEEKVADSMRKVEAWKKEWESIPLETRIACRDKVADNAEIKVTILETVRGPMQFMRSTPENNDNLYRANDRQKKEVKKRMPSGSITRDNNPLVPLKISPSIPSAIPAKRGRPALTSVPA